MAKTIRDIHITKKSSSIDKTSGSVPVRMKTSVKKENEPSAYTHSYREHSSSRGKGWLWGMLVIVIVGLVIWTLVGKVKVTVTPDVATVAGTVAVVAYADATAESLEYEVITLEDSLSKSIPAGDATFVEEKASGTIVIYNEEKTAQRFTEETRFESEDGLIFKLPKGDGITVPAAKGTTPGSIEATVYAEKAGETYNIDLADFVIPGWRETKSPKFKTQYARSKTPMTGGFSGTKRIVSDSDKKNTEESLQLSVTDRLLKEAPAQIPSEFVFFKNLSKVTFSPATSTDEEEAARVALSVKGTLYGILVRRDALSQILAHELIEDYNGEPILVTNFDELNVALVEPEILDSNATSVRFSVEGEPQFEWQINTDEVAEKLADTSSAEFDSIMSGISGIKSAVLKKNPFWLGSVAQDRIVIKINRELE